MSYTPYNKEQAEKDFRELLSLCRNRTISEDALPKGLLADKLLDMYASEGEEDGPVELSPTEIERILCCEHKASGGRTLCQVIGQSGVGRIKKKFMEETLYPEVRKIVKSSDKPISVRGIRAELHTGSDEYKVSLACTISRFLEQECEESKSLNKECKRNVESSDTVPVSHFWYED